MFENSFFWMLTTSYIIAILLQTYYFFSNSTNIIEIVIAIFFNTYMLLLLKFQYSSPIQHKQKTDYVSFGSTALDAVYGRKYNYDLILDKKEKTGEVHHSLINDVLGTPEVKAVSDHYVP